MTGFYELLRRAIRERPADHEIWRYNSKLAGRRLAESLGIPVPALIARPAPIMRLDPPSPPRPFVLKPNRGHSSRGVLLLVPAEEGRWLDLLSGDTHSWGRWRELALRTKREPTETQADRVRPPWLMEELVGDGTRPPAEWKLYAFADGSVPLARQRQALPGASSSRTARCCFWEPDPGGWKRVEGEIESDRACDPTLPASQHQAAMLEIASTLGRAAARPFIRVDLLEGVGGPVFGELTPEPSAGRRRFVPEWDARLGEHWSACS